ncbi:MAG: gamma-glutamylcyclotransferase family protein [Prolixibacteraceae bacterium]
MSYLFVYGTLLKFTESEVTQFLNRNSQFISIGSFPGKLYEVSGYPGAIYLPDESDRVSGNILEIPSAETVFAVLDLYEEVGDQFPEPNEYIRKQIPVEDNSGKIFNCWFYEYNWPVENLMQILSGDYAQFRKTLE